MEAGDPGLSLNPHASPAQHSHSLSRNSSAAILRGSGLILFDPQDPEAKRLTRGIFQKALRDADILRAALLARNKDLEAAGFHAQVSILENSTVLFYFQDGARYALEKKDARIFLKRQR